MSNIERALLVAERAHSNQQYDIYPYIYHVKQVMKVAEFFNLGEEFVIGAILHDTIEDSDLSYNDIKTAFGEEVAEIVYSVTDELGRNRKERKIKLFEKLRNFWKGAVVKTCDRIANMQHSKIYNPKMYQMYLKEQDEFIRELTELEEHSEIQKTLKYLKSI